MVTIGGKVARWFDRHPFRYEGPLGTKRTLSVIRVDLARLPMARLLDERMPSLAPLALAAHAKESPKRVRRIASKVLQVNGNERGRVSSATVDAILNLLDAKLRRELEAVMEREGYRTGWLQEAFLKGEARGMRKALIRVLAARGFKLSARVRKRIDSEADEQRLDRWLVAATTARTLAGVFADA